MNSDTIFSDVLSLIPTEYLGTAASIVTFAIASCALIMRFWKPPDAGSRWAPVYQIVSAIAQARGWNANAYQPGRKAIMAPVSLPRDEAAAALGLPPDQTKPGRQVRTVKDNAGEPDVI
ncbi:hypothetical protein [Acetobacter oeni]|nr:hypothetical protein [Acetobacter oeni]MBB3885004.1 hypothetical protein [Acetobacter oeni]NHO20873.1 hypothetical protein [Acetobacter oeni]